MKSQVTHEPTAGTALRRLPWKPLALLATVALVIVLSRQLGLVEHLDGLRGWIDRLGPWGPLAFLLIYTVGVVVAIPGIALTVAAGAIFGSVTGVVLVSAGSTAGAAISFLIGRYFARESTQRWLSSNERFRKLDRLTERRGAFIVAIVRLVPLFPFNLVNYGFGLTRVRFSTYVFWSWLCMLPATVLYVVGTDAVLRALAGDGIPWTLVTVAVVVLVGLLFAARRARGVLEKP